MKHNIYLTNIKFKILPGYFHRTVPIFFWELNPSSFSRILNWAFLIPYLFWTPRSRLVCHRGQQYLVSYENTQTAYKPEFVNIQKDKILRKMKLVKIIFTICIIGQSDGQFGQRTGGPPRTKLCIMLWRAGIQYPPWFKSPWFLSSTVGLWRWNFWCFYDSCFMTWL